MEGPDLNPVKALACNAGRGNPGRWPGSRPTFAYVERLVRRREHLMRIGRLRRNLARCRWFAVDIAIVTAYVAVDYASRKKQDIVLWIRFH